MFTRRNRPWWQATVAAWRQSGLTYREFAKAHDCHPATLNWWVRLLQREADELAGAQNHSAPEPARLVRVALAPNPPPARQYVVADACPTVVAIVGPAELRVAVGTDPGYVGVLVAAIARAVAPC